MWDFLVMITTQALQEGWDCPFAYLHRSLAASSNLKAMTQLVGRILRQPHAEKTGVDALNECHIVTHHAETASVVEAVKQGLERDGLGDLVLQVGAEDNADQLLSATGRSLRKSLFVPVYQQDFNADERKVAVYLDGELALKWWHRNAARSQYGLKGWQDRRIYPDFVFSVRPDGQSERITIIKTKGDHLDNIDTDYKRNLLAFLSNGRGRMPVEARHGLPLPSDGLPNFHYELVLMSDWKTTLPRFFTEDAQESSPSRPTD